MESQLISLSCFKSLSFLFRTVLNLQVTVTTTSTSGSSSVGSFSTGEETREGDVVESIDAMSEAASNPVCGMNPEKHQTIPKIHEAVDDFLRSLLVKFGLCRTLRAFESEWYGSVQRELLEALHAATLPNALQHHQLLQSELQRACKETARLREEALKAAECFMRTQKDKDFHQTQYRQELSHKNMVTEHISLLKKRIEHCKLALEQVDDKYEAALKEKMLLSLERTKSRPVKEGQRTRESHQ